MIPKVARLLPSGIPKASNISLGFISLRFSKRFFAICQRAILLAVSLIVELFFALSLLEMHPSAGESLSVFFSIGCWLLFKSGWP
jgi:hypothetical protein